MSRILNIFMLYTNYTVLSSLIHLYWKGWECTGDHIATQQLRETRGDVNVLLHPFYLCQQAVREWWAALSMLLVWKATELAVLGLPRDARALHLDEALSPSNTIHLAIKKKLNFLCLTLLLKKVYPKQFSFSTCCMHLAKIMTCKTEFSSFVATIIIKNISKYLSVITVKQRSSAPNGGLNLPEKAKHMVWDTWSLIRSSCFP